MNLLRIIEGLAWRGAEGLAPESRMEIAQAILGRCAADGGQTDLGGKRSDPYYSLFAWLCLRALNKGAPLALERYFKTCTCKNPIDLYSKQLVCLQNLQGLRRSLACLGFLLCHPPRTPYTLLLSGLLAEIAFPRLTTLFIRLIRLPSQQAISTSRIAAQIILNQKASNKLHLKEILLRRRAQTGGFSSADGVLPDLLATAAAHVALGPSCPESWKDLAFTEACWAPNGLFAPHPGSTEGDVEHTFYALLVLGSCR